MNVRRVLVRLCLLALCLEMAAGMALAQSQANTGQIVGNVYDPNGAVVPGAKITVTSLDTGLTRELVTNEAGQYRAVLLPAGRYKVEVSATGFSPATATDVVVNVGTAVDVNFTLKIGAVAETIEVSAPLIEITRSEPGTVMDDRAIANLPINGRRFHDLATVAPNAIVEPRRSQISILGQRGINTAIYIDGGDYNEPFFGGIRGGERSIFAFTVPQESIAEFQVISAGYAPEFGRSTGGIVMAITKTGTNTLHGSAFYLLRQKELGVKDALNQQSLQNRHMFGGSLGGPLRRDRMFFFGAAEQQFIRNPRTVFFPTLRATPLTPANAEGWNFFKSLEQSFQDTNDATAINGRFDYQFTRGHRFFARYNHSRNTGENATSTGTQLSPLTTSALSNNGTEIDRTHTALGQLVSILSPSVANELRFQHSREQRPRLANAQSPTVETTVGRFGTTSFLPTTLTDDRFQVSDNVNWQRGGHSMKVGFEYNFVNVFQQFGFNQFGRFSTTRTSNVDVTLRLLSRPPASGMNRFDSDLVTYQRQIGNLLLDFSGHDAAFFFQDNWRIRPSFTLNYGLRWEGEFLTDPETSNKEMLNRVLNTAFPLGRMNPSEAPSLVNQVMPRLGFAWDPGRAGKTVVRGHFGLFYARTPMLVGAGPANNFRIPPGDLSIQLPFRVPTGNPNNTVYRQLLLIGVDLNQFPLDKLPLLTPEQIQSIPARLGIEFNPFRGTQPNGWMGSGYRNPRAVQWGFGVEREMARGFAAFANFHYVNTVHLLRNRDFNLPVPVIRPDDRAQRPFFGVASGRTPRPESFFDSVTAREASARSLYRGGTVGVRFNRKRVQFGVHYTASANFSDSDEEREAGGFSYENGFNLKPEYNYNNLDARHQFVGHVVLALPWGIEVASSGRVRSELPFSPWTGGDTNEDRNSNVGADRAFRAPGVPFRRNSFRDQALKNIDLRVLKGFRLWNENAKLQLSAEMFNLLNFDNILLGSRNQIYGLGVAPATGDVLPPQNTPSASFRRLKLADGRVDPNNTVGGPFQFQIGLRLVF